MCGLKGLGRGREENETKRWEQSRQKAAEGRSRGMVGEDGGRERSGDEVYRDEEE